MLLASVFSNLSPIVFISPGSSSKSGDMRIAFDHILQSSIKTDSSEFCFFVSFMKNYQYPFLDMNLHNDLRQVTLAY